MAARKSASWWRGERFGERISATRQSWICWSSASMNRPFPCRQRARDQRPFLDKWRVRIRGCLVALGLCAGITLIADQFLMAFEAANLVMLYLLGVVIVALFTAAGRRCSPR
ncbi:hypothetical protein ACLK1Y_03815 [Escherichia coli]